MGSPSFLLQSVSSQQCQELWEGCCHSHLLPGGHLKPHKDPGIQTRPYLPSFHKSSVSRSLQGWKLISISSSPLVKWACVNTAQFIYDWATYHSPKWAFYTEVSPSILSFKGKIKIHYKTNMYVMCMIFLTLVASLILYFAFLCFWDSHIYYLKNQKGKAHTLPQTWGIKCFINTFFKSPFQPSKIFLRGRAWLNKDFPFCPFSNYGQLLHLQASGFIGKKILQKKAEPSTLL